MYSVLYRSLASPDFTKEDIYKMLSHSRAFNKSHGITGCLLFHQGQFLQLIEGEADEVIPLYDRIKYDSRHNLVTTLELRDDAERIFNNWDMAFHDFGEDNEAAYYKLQQIDTFFRQSSALNSPSEMANTFFKNVRSMLLRVS